MSLLCQTEERFEVKRFPQTTLSQALLLERVVGTLGQRFHDGSGAITPQELAKVLQVTLFDMEVVMRFLRRRKVIVYVVGPTHPDGSAAMLAKALNENDLIKLIKDFLDLAGISQNFDVVKLLSRLS